MSNTAMTSLTTEQKGEIAVLKVRLEAHRKGILVLEPTTPARYDLGLDYGDRFYRAQVKYADAKTPNSEGSLRVDLKRRNKCYTRDEIDVLLVYVAQLDKVCWFSADEFHNRTAICLRVKPARNGQQKGCHLVEEFFW